MSIQVVVHAARFEQQHAGVGVGRQPVGEHAAGGAGPGDDVVVRHAGILPTRADLEALGARPAQGAGCLTCRA